MRTYSPHDTHNPRGRNARGDPVQTSSCQVPSATPTCPGAGATPAVDPAGRCPSGGAGGGAEPARGRAGHSPGRWGRSGCRRLGTPRSSPPPRSPERRRGWQQTSLKHRSVTFRAGVGPHPHGPPAHRPTPPLRSWIQPTRAQSTRVSGWRGEQPPQAAGRAHRGQHGQRTAQCASRPAPTEHGSAGRKLAGAGPPQGPPRAPADREARPRVLSDGTPGLSCK